MHVCQAYDIFSTEEIELLKFLVVGALEEIRPAREDITQDRSLDMGQVLVACVGMDEQKQCLESINRKLS